MPGELEFTGFVFSFRLVFWEGKTVPAAHAPAFIKATDVVGTLAYMDVLQCATLPAPVQ